jgi:glycosyltransferase involved in cell wall biosynthesis
MNNSIPLLSIITVCLNEPQLERTCESIVNQTFQGFEWIVIDGGSNEETLAVFEKYKSRMDYFVSEPDGGIYLGMNKGILQAKGEWINFMNGGDSFADSDVLQRIFFNPVIDDDFDVLYGDIYCINKEKKLLRTYPKDTLLDKHYFYFYFLPHLAMFYRRGLFEDHGGYDVNFRVLADTKKNIDFFTVGAKYRHLNTIVAIFGDNRSGDTLSHERQEMEHKIIRKVYFDESDIQIAQEKYSRENYMKMIFTDIRKNL